MGKRKRDSKGNDGEQFFTMGYRTAQSPAWRSLNGPAVKVFIELRTRFNGRNNGRLHLSLEESKRLLGLGKSTVARALEELEEKGFIKKTRQGQFYGRMASEYALTEKPLNGYPATKDWRQWSPQKSRALKLQKQNRGPETGHNRTSTGSRTGTRTSPRPTTKPVNGSGRSLSGPETGRLYRP